MKIHVIDCRQVDTDRNGKFVGKVKESRSNVEVRFGNSLFKIVTTTFYDCCNSVFEIVTIMILRLK